MMLFECLGCGRAYGTPCELHHHMKEACIYWDAHQKWVEYPFQSEIDRLDAACGFWQSKYLERCRETDDLRAERNRLRAQIDAAEVWWRDITGDLDILFTDQEKAEDCAPNDVWQRVLVIPADEQVEQGDAMQNIKEFKIW